MTGEWGEKPNKGSIDKKTLENKEIKHQIEINEKSSNQKRTEEKNWSVGEAGYYIFVFLFWVLVVVGRLCFYLVLRDRAIKSQTI